MKAVIQPQVRRANLILHCGAMTLIERSRLLPEPRAFATFMNRKKARQCLSFEVTQGKPPG